RLMHAQRATHQLVASHQAGTTRHSMALRKQRPEGPSPCCPANASASDNRSSSSSLRASRGRSSGSPSSASSEIKRYLTLQIRWLAASRSPTSQRDSQTFNESLDLTRSSRCPPPPTNPAVIRSDHRGSSTR